jgi:diguanylate cyclase (GGDEF)-like protein/PAS domain S-box-containing protein
LALLLFAVALLARLWLLPADLGLVFVTFYPAILLGFYLCGIGPGALLTLLCVLTANYLFIQPSSYFAVYPASALSLVFFLLSAVLIGWIVRRLQIFTDKLKHALDALRVSEQRYLGILEDQTEFICRFKADGAILFVNDAFCRLFAKSRDSLIGEQWQPLAYAEDLPNINAQLAALSPEHPLVSVENRVLTADNTLRWGQFVNRAFFDAAGRLLEIQSVGRDITDLKLAEQKLELAAQVFTHSREGIIITAEDGKIIEVNAAFSQITGYSRAEALGNTYTLFNSDWHDQPLYPDLWRGLRETDCWCGEIWSHRKNGAAYPQLITICAMPSALNNSRQYLIMFSDITELKDHERHLQQIAHFDALTGLPNRVLLADRLQQALSQTERRGRLLALAYLDLDGFKAINDNHGHEAGDQLLISLANQMKLVLREGDTLARIGGDEFVAVLPDLVDTESCLPLISRLLAAAGQAVTAGNLELQVTASLGLAFYPQSEAVGAEELLQQADQAMYQAKLSGKNRYHIFDAETDNRLKSHHESLKRIREALAAGEFVLHYQPTVNMRSGAVIGAEALLRWQHPEQGFLPPAEFLPCIEDHPLAIEIGDWVINRVLSQIGLWHAAGLDLAISVNVGPRQLRHPGFVDSLRRALASHPHVRPSQLGLEVQESSALADVGLMSRTIEACRELGVSLALDNFGADYASLTTLKRLPFSYLKIDQGFVRDMLHAPYDLAILDGVLGLAGAFGQLVIAEGVETQEHCTMLLQLGCELAQGYAVAHPMPAEKIPAWSAAWRPQAAWAAVPLLSRTDLPLLFAGAKQLAWLTSLENHLKDQQSPPPLDYNQCHFGKWLASEGLSRYAELEAFQALLPLHKQLHALAAELVALRAGGQAPAALARMDEARALEDRLLARLHDLPKQSLNLAGMET